MTKKGKKNKWTRVPIEQLGLGGPSGGDWRPIKIEPHEDEYMTFDLTKEKKSSSHYTKGNKQSLFLNFQIYTPH